MAVILRKDLAHAMFSRFATIAKKPKWEVFSGNALSPPRESGCFYLGWNCQEGIKNSSLPSNVKEINKGSTTVEARAPVFHVPRDVRRKISWSTELIWAHGEFKGNPGTP